MQEIQNITNSILNRKSKESSSLYIIFDVAAREGALKNIYNICPSPKICKLYSGTYFENIIDKSPVLIHVEESDNIFRWFIEHGCKENGGIILASPYDMPSLSSHLKSILEIRKPDYNMVLFRFYNPTFTYCVNMAFTPDRFSLFWGAATELWLALPTLQQGWRWMEWVASHNLHKDTLRNFQSHSFWSTSEEEWSSLNAALTEYNTIPRLARRLWIEDSAIGLDGLTEEEVLREVRRLVEIAKKLGIQTQSDLYMFADLELTYLKNFHQHPLIPQYIKEKIQNGENPLRTMSMDLQDIIDELYVPPEEAWPSQYAERLATMKSSE